MSIQPVNKAAEHLINSTPVWGGGGGDNKISCKCLFYKEQVGGGGGGTLSQAVGRIGRSIMSQSILRNYFKVFTKFTLEGAE